MAFGLDFTAFLIFFVVFLLTILLLFRPKSGVPGPTAWPFIGNLFLIDKLQTSPSKTKILASLVQKYGQIFRLFLGPYQVVFVLEYKNVAEILRRKGQDFVDRPNWLPLIEKFQKITRGNGITWSNGDQWKAYRRFAVRSMRDFGVGKTSLEEKILEEVQDIIYEFEISSGRDVDNVRDILTRGSCNILHYLLFGYRFNHSNPKLNELISNFHDIFGSANALSAGGLFPAVKTLFNKKVKLQRNAMKYVAEHIFDQIKQHRQSFDENNIRDFVDIYIKSENEESGNETQNGQGELFCLIGDLFVGGTDTTATTLDWSILYMIGYPEVQRKCQKEITNIVGPERMVKTTDKPKLRYVEATLMEVQRLANTVEAILPHVATCDSTISGYQIRKGTIVSAILTSVHKDESVWENPHTFDPSRFLDVDGNIVNKEFLMPFGAGPRICPGESLARTEMFLIFSNLLQRFTFSKANPVDNLSFEGITGITRVAPPYCVRAKLR